MLINTAYNVRKISNQNYTELWLHENPQQYNFKQNHQTNTRRKFKDLNPNEQLKSIKDKQYKAKQKRFDISRIIDTNFADNYYKSGHLVSTKFLTLTFKNKYYAKDIKTTNRLFKNFNMRLNRYLKKHFNLSLKYICAWEIQPHSKRIHYHLVLFDFPYIKNKDLQNIWGNGFIRINQIKEINQNKKGLYISKYISKTIENDIFNQYKVKKFFKSNNLKSIKEKHFLVNEINPNYFQFDKDKILKEKKYYQTKYDPINNRYYRSYIKYYVIKK